VVISGCKLLGSGIVGKMESVGNFFSRRTKRVAMGMLGLTASSAVKGKAFWRLRK
jgi:hypothetical protein